MTEPDGRVTGVVKDTKRFFLDMSLGLLREVGVKQIGPFGVTQPVTG